MSPPLFARRIRIDNSLPVYERVLASDTDCHEYWLFDDRSNHLHLLRRIPFLWHLALTQAGGLSPEQLDTMMKAVAVGYQDIAPLPNCFPYALGGDVAMFFKAPVNLHSSNIELSTYGAGSGGFSAGRRVTLHFSASVSMSTRAAVAVGLYHHRWRLTPATRDD